MNHVIVYLTLLAILCSYYVVHITGSNESHGSYHSPFEIVFFLCPALGVLFSVAGRSRVEMKRRIFGLDGLCRQTDWRWSFRLGKILVPRKYKREWL